MVLTTLNLVASQTTAPDMVFCRPPRRCNEVFMMPTRQHFFCKNGNGVPLHCKNVPRFNKIILDSLCDHWYEHKETYSTVVCMPGQ